MSVLPLVSLVSIWSQAAPWRIPDRLQPLLAWLFLLGEPAFSIPGLLGGVITWFKVISLFCLLGWVVSWLATAFKERLIASGSALDITALVAVFLGIGALLIHELVVTGRVSPIMLGPVSAHLVLALASLAAVILWAEAGIWRSILRLGKGADLAVLAGMHVALLIGVVVGIVIHMSSPQAPGDQTSPWRAGIVTGFRLGGTFMGYVVLVRVSLLVLGEVINVRGRRLMAIATLSVIESNRRMWAPWVVITVFFVILAFTHWFLQPPRPAEMGRLFVGSLTLLCSLLLTVMVTLLTPLSIPHDIQSQTIYTVVSKPVRRIELIWGRMIGFMTIVTVLVLVFGGISLLYLWRTVGGTIVATEKEAAAEAKQNHTVRARLLREQAEQLRTRMSARVPIKGSLTFLDSRGTPHVRGIDVGMEQSMREPRSHIEGATPATAIWQYGVVPDPYNPQMLLDRRIPVGQLLDRNSIEGLLDQVTDLKRAIDHAEAESQSGGANLTAARAEELKKSAGRNREQMAKFETALRDQEARARNLEAKAREAETAGKPTEAADLLEQAAALHAQPIVLEMTFNVYRTTKGRVGEPVYAELEVTNPQSGEKYRNIFPIREYYTNKQVIPPRLLAGSQGALKVEVRCISPTQYLGMSESDLYILVHKGTFGANFMKGLFGVWLQAMVLTAIGVCAGTFLSWPVALLTTIAFVVAGQVFFGFLLSFSSQTLIGGGPFESLIRLLTHENQMSDLAPTVSVVTAKTLDAIVMPVMSRLVYIVPNFTALDVSNTVADGFAVTWGQMITNLLFTLAYVLPFSIAGYFILKQREVAA